MRPTVHFPVEEHTFREHLPEGFIDLPTAFKTCCEIFRDTWKEAGKADEMMNAIFMGFTKDKMYTCFLKWDGDGEKSRMKAMLRAFCHERKIGYYCFGSEVWIRATPEGDTRKPVEIQNDPTVPKVDGLFVIGIGHDRSKMYHKQWTRTPAPDTEGKWEYREEPPLDGMSFEGEMTEFLIPRGSDMDLHMMQVRQGELTEDQAELLGDLAGYLNRDAPEQASEQEFKRVAQHVLEVLDGLATRLTKMPFAPPEGLIAGLEALTAKAEKAIETRNYAELKRLEQHMQEAYEAVLALREGR